MDTKLHLKLYQQYSRKDVHDIFDPSSPFTTGSGTWGIHGIVKIPNRENDFVFFVTFGQSKLGHAFEEEITEDGVLTWQSQPKQKLNNKIIRQLINHNYTKNNIYFFLRTKKINKDTKRTELFTYLGNLAYINHDLEREKPVYFNWGIIEWNIPPEEILYRMDLKLKPNAWKEEEDTLVQTEKPNELQKHRGVKTRDFKARKFNFIEKNVMNHDLGLQGELLVLEYEKKQLNHYGYPKLASKVIHTSIEEGDGAGYDLISYKTDGSVKYLEIKTTTKGIETPFFMTAAEVEFSKKHKESYFLYRIYEYNPRTNSGKFFIIEGNLTRYVELQSIQFKAILK
ncbi:hypothetical protein COE99_09420 [Bacillus toyonensis]|uniref:DUF3427 domain-containing protein n=1 Tax=Bacillus toyonensis TaxID=155322 RepID=UPI000BFD19EC|nr:DUF3427 domain-containing protein [Bacillus toyonensis]PHC09920.1 hypothetical protein COE99_09420 [Bacillus toyonensis]